MWFLIHCIHIYVHIIHGKYQVLVMLRSTWSLLSLKTVTKINMKTWSWMMTVCPWSQRVHVLQSCLMLHQFSTSTSVYITTGPWSFPDQAFSTFLTNLRYFHMLEKKLEGLITKIRQYNNSCTKVTTYQRHHCQTYNIIYIIYLYTVYVQEDFSRAWRSSCISGNLWHSQDSVHVYSEVHLQHLPLTFGIIVAFIWAIINGAVAFLQAWFVSPWQESAWW